MAVSPGDPLGSLLQAVCKANNVDCGKISMVQVDPAAKVVTVLEKKADALLGGADDQFFLIKQRGFTPAAMRYADWGANIVGMTIVAKTETLQKNPDLVRRFLRASVKSWEEAKKNPAAAVDAALKAKPDLNKPVHARPDAGRLRADRQQEQQGPHRLRCAGRLGPDARRSSRTTATCRRTSRGRRSTPTSSCPTR